MGALAALGDAPTAVIAVLAIVLGLIFVARGPRDRRGGGDAGAAAPLEVPSESGATTPEHGETAAAQPSPMTIGEVGHGRIKLGGSDAAADPQDAPPPEPVAAMPEAVGEPAQAVEPAPLDESMPPVEPATPDEPTPPALEPAPDPSLPPPFRHGAIKLGGQPTGEPPADESPTGEPPADEPPADQ